MLLYFSEDVLYKFLNPFCFKYIYISTLQVESNCQRHITIAIVIKNKALNNWQSENISNEKNFSRWEKSISFYGIKKKKKPIQYIEEHAKLL